MTESQSTVGHRANKSKVRNLVIAQIIGGLNIGGAEKHFVNLINEMSANDRLAVFLGQKHDERTLHEQLDSHVIQKYKPIRKRSFPVGVLALARELAKSDCDVVHTHMFWANLYGTIAARLAGVPVIVTSEHGENRWKKPYHRWLERNLISRIADMRYCVSQDILVQRRDVDGVPVANLKLMANGTVLPNVPTQLWNHEEPVLGSVGRFVSQKNFDLFVDIIAVLRSRGYSIRGCLVGDGPEMRGIRKKVTELGLENVIDLPGMVTEMDSWFRYFDIYAITSKEEGLPVSLLEAMSYGLPVVASDVGAISTAIRSAEEGSVVPANDIDRFVDAVATYLDDRALATKTGRKARARVAGEFSIQAIAAKYESEYLAIMDRKAG